jgi:hypothetical protein
MAIRCASCSEAIELPDNGRLPPWCPRCGDYLKKSSATSPSAAPNVPAWTTTPAAVAVHSMASAAATTSRTNTGDGRAQSNDETRVLAVHDFSMRGFLHKVSPGIMIVVIFLALSAGMFALAIRRPGQGTTMPGLICAVIAAAVIGYMFTLYGKCIRRVEVFANELRWLGPDGLGRLSWDNIANVYRSEIVLNGFPTSELKLVARDGREVVFDRTIEQYFDLARFVQERCAQLMLPWMREEARESSTDFGPVRVGAVGITIDGLLIPWESVANYSIANGRLWFQLRECGSKGFPLHTIPNYVALLHLMSELAPQVRKGAGLPVAAG